MGGPLFLVATVAYGLQNVVNTELMILLYVYALLGLAIYVPMILTDQVSLAYAAYAGIGGYSVAILSSRSLEALWGVLLGMVLAGLTAYLVALATRKLSGYFLAVGNLARCRCVRSFPAPTARLNRRCRRFDLSTGNLNYPSIPDGLTGCGGSDDMGDRCPDSKP